jgi:predicted lipid-binding transport protein (Tim44 family)
MDSGYQIIDILLFAGIAGFLVFRLRSVLGRRTGLEQRRNLFAPPQTPPPASQAPPAPQPAAPRLRAVDGGAAPSASGLDALKSADPSFTEDSFLKGARGAFEIIVNSFAAGDKAALKPLLSKDVYERFAEAIDTRLAAKETLQSNLISMKSAEIVDSSLEGGTALVTVKFVSEQTNVTRAADGTVRDGDPGHVEEHVDFWTFARPVRARDPNWTLVATHSP